MKIETKKEKKRKPLVPVGTGTKGSAHVARPGGPFSPGWYYRPLVPDEKPGLKEGPFSPGFMLPVGKPELKGFPNREYSLFLYQ